MRDPLPHGGAAKHGSGLCRNCGTPAPGNFCPYCGQSTALHVLSILEFGHEIVSHYVALEGKLWRTLALLALQPGRLTREFLAGRRQRYVIPLRLYLTASFLFFAVSQWIGHPVEVVVARPDRAADAAATVPGAAGAADKDEFRVEDLIGSDPVDVQESPGRVDIRVHRAGPGLDATLARVLREMCGSEKAADCVWWKRLPARAIANLRSDPTHVVERFAERFRHSLSYSMFLLLPAFAALLALVYGNRKMYYGEHLVFALHLHSFWFLISFVFLALPEAFASLLPVWFVAYGYWALRRVYGGRWGPTLLRGSAVGVLYSLAIGLVASVLSMVLLAT